MYINESSQNSYRNNDEDKSEQQEQDPKKIEEKECIILSSDGKTEYFFNPFLSKEIAKRVENETGIILKKEENEEKYNSFLGGGAFGKFYVVQNKTSNQICGIKIIRGRIEESLFEGEIQRDLTIKIDKEESRLMPLLDIIKEKDENGKLTCLYYIMPLASFGNVNSLRMKLKKENDQLLKRLVTKIMAQDILIEFIKCINLVIII